MYRLHTAAPHCCSQFFGSKTLGVTREWGWRLERYGSIKHKGHFGRKRKLISQQPECAVTFTNLHRPFFLLTLQGLSSIFRPLFGPNKSHCWPLSISQYISQYSGFISSWKSSIGFNVVSAMGNLCESPQILKGSIC